MSTTFRSLRVRNYRLFASGQLVKLIGTWMLFTAQDWLVLQLTHDSPTALGLVTMLQFTPVLLLTLLAGQLADRFDKRKLLLLANTGSALVALALGALVVTGTVELWHVFITAAGFGAISAMETPARQSFISELVGRELLPNALSLGSATFNSARIVGPAVAGPLIFLCHDNTGPVFLLTGVMVVGTLVGLLRMRPAELHRGDLVPVKASDARILDGLRYVWRRADVRQAILLVAIVGLFGFNFQLTLAVLAKSGFHTNAQYFGLLTTALAVGALGGALSGTHRRSRPTAYVVFTAATLFGAFETLVGFSPTFPVALALLVPTGYFMVFFAQAANQRVQLGIDAEYRGRVMAIYVLVFLGSTPIGSPVMGWLAEQFGPRAGIVLGGASSLAAAVAMGLLQVRRERGKVRVHLRPKPHFHVFEPVRESESAAVR